MKKIKQDLTIYQMEQSSIEFKKSHTVSVSSLKDNELPLWFKKFHEEEFKPLVQTVIKMQNEVPLWFKKFHEEEFKPLVQTVIKMQNEPPKWFIDFANEQRQFNKMILNKIDNLVIKNNLQE